MVLSSRELEVLEQNLTRMEQLRISESKEVDWIVGLLAPARLVKVPMLAKDISNIEDLAKMARSLI